MRRDLVVQRRLLELFACPRCGDSLDAEGGPEPGSVVCPRGHRFPVEDGYLDLAEEHAPDATTSRTFESFGYEWNTFDDVREEDSQFADVYFRDLDVASLHGLVGLDAGCGKGRYTRFLAPHLEALVALDGSSAVRAAARNLSSFPNVLVVRADLRTVPVIPGSVDLVVSLGVLHHLADPRDGFRRLVKMLSPTGRILVYLYSRPAQFGARRMALSAAAVFRAVTVRTPHRLLRLASAPVAALLYLGVVQLGAFGQRVGVGPLARLPMAGYRGKPFRSLLLDTFDRLSAPVEHRYLWEELAPWFEEEGLTVDATRDEAGWFVLAHRAPAVPE
jgi:SAM-dependent methyltransferase